MTYVAGIGQRVAQAQVSRDTIWTGESRATEKSTGQEWKKSKKSSPEDMMTACREPETYRRRPSDVQIRNSGGRILRRERGADVRIRTRENIE